MKTYEKIYDKLSKIYFAIHTLVFLLVFVASFLPFRGEQNFYQVFTGFPMNAFLLLGFLLVVCLMAYLAIKRPLFAILLIPFSLNFYSFMLAPSTGAIFRDIFYGANDYQKFGIGYELMSFTTNVTILEVPFTIYAIVVGIFKVRDKWEAKKALKQ